MVKIMAEVTGVKKEWQERLAYDVLTFIKSGTADKIKRDGDRVYLVCSITEEYFAEGMNGLWERYAKRRLMNGMELNIKVLEK